MSVPRHDDHARTSTPLSRFTTPFLFNLTRAGVLPTVMQSLIHKSSSKKYKTERIHYFRPLVGSHVLVLLTVEMFFYRYGTENITESVFIKLHVTGLAAFWKVIM